MSSIAMNIYSAVAGRWNAIDNGARGALLVSSGSLTLVMMATLVKYLRTALTALQILFFPSLASFCFFWSLASMLLADAMALQFSRPLFTIPLALIFLGELAVLRRTAMTL